MLLTETARLADVAMPVHPYRERFFSSSAAPSFCACMQLVSRSAETDALWLGATERLGNVTHASTLRVYPPLGSHHMREQEAIWFEWVWARARLRMLAKMQILLIQSMGWEWSLPDRFSQIHSFLQIASHVFEP